MVRYILARKIERRLRAAHCAVLRTRCLARIPIGREDSEGKYQILRGSGAEDGEYAREFFKHSGKSTRDYGEQVWQRTGNLPGRAGPTIADRADSSLVLSIVGNSTRAQNIRGSLRSSGGRPHALCKYDQGAEGNPGRHESTRRSLAKNVRRHNDTRAIPVRSCRIELL